MDCHLCLKQKLKKTEKIQQKGRKSSDSARKRYFSNPNYLNYDSLKHLKNTNETPPPPPPAASGLPAWHVTPSNLLYTKQFQSQDGTGRISEMLFNSTKPFFGNWDQLATNMGMYKQALGYAIFIQVEFFQYFLEERYFSLMPFCGPTSQRKCTRAFVIFLISVLSIKIT